MICFRIYRVNNHSNIFSCRCNTCYYPLNCPNRCIICTYFLYYIIKSCILYYKRFNSILIAFYFYTRRFRTIKLWFLTFVMKNITHTIRKNIIFSYIELTHRNIHSIFSSLNFKVKFSRITLICNFNLNIYCFSFCGKCYTSKSHRSEFFILEWFIFHSIYLKTCPSLFS